VQRRNSCLRQHAGCRHDPTLAPTGARDTGTDAGRRGACRPAPRHATPALTPQTLFLRPARRRVNTRASAKCKGVPRGCVSGQGEFQSCGQCCTDTEASSAAACELPASIHKLKKLEQGGFGCDQRGLAGFWCQPPATSDHERLCLYYRLIILVLKYKSAAVIVFPTRSPGREGAGAGPRRCAAAFLARAGYILPKKKLVELCASQRIRERPQRGHWPARGLPTGLCMVCPPPRPGGA
jgi:hypothetical protein